MSNFMYHVTLLSNLKSIKKHGLLCQIGPRSQEIGEPTKVVYVFPNLDYANDAVMNWLGNEFNDDDELIILPVKLTEKDVDCTPDIDYERRSTVDIPARLIDFKHIINCQ